MCEWLNLRLNYLGTVHIDSCKFSSIYYWKLGKEQVGDIVIHFPQPDHRNSKFGLRDAFVKAQDNNVPFGSYNTDLVLL